MKQIVTTTLVTALASIASAGAILSSSANATLLDPLEASVLVQSTATDTDSAFLGDFFGFAPAQTLTYSSSSTLSSWSGTLTGTYLGTSLSLTYFMGNLSAYPGGPITWTTSGSYGTGSWSGGGSATITELTPTTVEVAFIDFATLGSLNTTLSYTIPGTVLDGVVMFGDPDNLEVGTGTQTGNVAAVKKCYSYEDAAMTVVSDIVFNPKKPCSYYGDIYKNYYTKEVGANTVALSGTIETLQVPEPPSLAVIGMISVLGLALIRRPASSTPAHRIA